MTSCKYPCEFVVNSREVASGDNDSCWNQVALVRPPCANATTPIDSAGAVVANAKMQSPETPVLQGEAITYTCHKAAAGVDQRQTDKRQTRPPRTANTEPLPWETFLPVTLNNNVASHGPVESHKLSTNGAAGGGDFNDLLEEGKKRLERAGNEERMRQRAEIVGHMGDGALADLLADLREPSFSRRQNE